MQRPSPKNVPLFPWHCEIPASEFASRLDKVPIDGHGIGHRLRETVYEAVSLSRTKGVLFSKGAHWASGGSVGRPRGLQAHWDDDQGCWTRIGNEEIVTEGSEDDG